ncbi:hypothetical protein GCM10025781_11140 [Kocuria gwangalliensis]|uniref:Uncharacterized protein n=1 Tax=Kocuria gwangalliensis TaxID=501592 RepID=A0ABP8WTG3_9MICC
MHCPVPRDAGDFHVVKYTEYLILAVILDRGLEQPERFQVIKDYAAATDVVHREEIKRRNQLLTFTVGELKHARYCSTTRRASS